MSNMPNSPKTTSTAPINRSVPAWATSAIFHVVLLFLALFFLQRSSKGVLDAPLRSAGIVLKSVAGDETRYEGDQGEEETAAEAAQQSLADQVAQLPSNAPSQEVLDALPESPGTSSSEVSGESSAAWTEGGSKGPVAGLSGEKAKVSIFGATGEGYKFVYVFDRSASMEGPRLAAAKRELIASLASLYDTHQFQIVFFNHNTRVWDLTGGQRRVPFATERNKELAARWVSGVTADGSTNREAALEAAMRLRPDIIFFLTDDEGPLAESELQRLLRKNRADAAIFTIEFGLGPAHGRRNFLVRLAEKTRGQYVYVNTRRLGP